MNKEKFYLRIFDKNHPNDWKYFFVCWVACDLVYFGLFQQFEIKNNLFPYVWLGWNLITPIAMFFCELGERSIYG